VFCAEHDMHQVETQRLRHGTNYMSGLQPSPVPADTYLGLRPRLACRQAFGLQSLLRSITSQPDPKQRATRDVTNPDFRPTPGSEAPQNISAEGATTYQPGPDAQVGSGQTARGLKARHILSAKSAKHTSLGRRPRLGTVQNVGGLKARHIAGLS
jgi:hypothetical protein